MDARRFRHPWAAARTSVLPRIALVALLLSSLLAACGAPAGTSSPGVGATATAASPTSSAPAPTAPTAEPSSAAGFPATIVDDEGTEVPLRRRNGR